MLLAAHPLQLLLHAYYLSNAVSRHSCHNITNSMIGSYSHLTIIDF